MLLRWSSWRIAVLLGLAAAFFAVDAHAADTAAGSKNFSVPASVPNYFSNEAGPLQGPASETQRGPLYMNQTYGTARAAATVPRGRQHVALAEPHGRLIRGRVAYDRRGRTVAGHRSVVHGRPSYHTAARAGPIHHAVTHAGVRGPVAHVAAHPHMLAHKTTSVSTAYHYRRS